jgi:hypothetical protein
MKNWKKKKSEQKQEDFFANVNNITELNDLTEIINK